jgi:glycerophosphoryl diester phosphodiesterase
MTQTPLLLGHRGARAIRSVAENTPASFDLALEHGCDGFEFDVRLTSDGRAVVCHDPRIGRTSVARAERHQLSTLPLLHEVLARFGKRGFLDMELKVRGLEPIVLSALRTHPPSRGFVISSFLPDVLLELRARRAAVPLGIICERSSQLERGRKLPVDYWIVHATLVNRRLVEAAHGAGKKVFVWTVNTARAMARFAALGVEGLISDQTELLVKTLRPPPRPDLLSRL